jgi:hypothetical protein
MVVVAEVGVVAVAALVERGASLKKASKSVCNSAVAVGERHTGRLMRL